MRLQTDQQRIRARIEDRLDTLHRAGKVHGRTVWAIKQDLDELDACYQAEWAPPPAVASRRISIRVPVKVKGE